MSIQKIYGTKSNFPYIQVVIGIACIIVLLVFMIIKYLLE